jgi:hypothetical protein
MITLEEELPEAKGACNKRDFSKSNFKEYKAYFDGIEARSILVNEFVAS